MYRLIALARLLVAPSPPAARPVAGPNIRDNRPTVFLPASAFALVTRPA